MKRILAVMLLLGLSTVALQAKEAPVVISTDHTTMILEADPGQALKFVYYGSRLRDADVESVVDSPLNFRQNAFPVFGADMMTGVAMQVIHADGNPTLDLAVASVETSTAEAGVKTVISLVDRHYPFTVKVCYETRDKSDVIEQWTEISHTEKKVVELARFDSAFMPIRRGDVWASHMDGGSHGAEGNLVEEPLHDGILAVKGLEGNRNGAASQAEMMFSLDGKPDQLNGRVIGAALQWTGTFELRVDTDNNTFHRFFIGINPLGGPYRLDPKTVFDTPRVLWTYSEEGVGGASRNYHRWARSGGMHGGDRVRDVLLNSWEPLRFETTEENMFHLIDEVAEIGGELFVMDDGWFGDKYPRTGSSSSLGDWVVDRNKLPGGVTSLVDRCRERGVKFGIWIEPESVNTVSELFEKHPDWALEAKYRTPNYGRGGNQLILDLSNPAVQDHVFNVVDRLMQENPDIAYFKWDCNCSIRNYGSNYLPSDRQTNLYVDYQRGFLKTLQRIREKYPDVVMQACGGGGARISMGALPYFDEFWVSDNTDGLHRLFIQWAISYFTPVMAMAQHIGVQPAMDGRTIPMKYRFDVAMTGRLGLELLPYKMTPEEKVYAKRTIAEYKTFRDVIQLGDQYRILSPYDNDVASMMYVTETKDRAVFFAFKVHNWNNQPVPRFRMAGLDPAKSYRLHELSVAEGARPIDLEGKVFSGAVLLHTGVELNLGREYGSRVLELVEID